MAQKKKFYAVRTGHQPGIYLSWDDCKRQVDGFPKAKYKSFSTRQEAEDYLNEVNRTPAPKAGKPKPPKPLEIATEVIVPKFLPGLKATDHQVVLFTDGACTGNPGRGGYGALLLYQGEQKEFSGGYRLTTNNRMEILACIVGLQALKEPCDVTIYSDSKYVVNAMTQNWALKWRRRGWKRRLGDGSEAPALNADLWAQMLELCDKHRVKFEWVRGHDGNEGNERCDQLARAAAASSDLGIDTVYENC
jgi:ribonuclease HI